MFTITSMYNDNDTFYNKLELIPPPQLSFRLCCKNPEAISRKLRSILGKAVNILKDQSSLHKESATLSRLIYRWKWRMRNDKGFKALEKVNRSLLQYLALGMLSVLEKAHEKVYEEYGPSKQVIEWVLVRLQGFSKLFDNIYDRCMEAATYLQWRFQNGHVWSAALISTAVVSRIWIISQYLVKESCKWYNNLKQILPVLQSSVQSWLPENCVLPDDLTAWLGYPMYLLKEKNVDEKIFSFLSQDDETEIKNSETPDMDGRRPVQTLVSKSYILAESCKEDIGESVSRTVDENNVKKVKLLSKKNKTGKDEIKKNKNDRGDSVTNHIDNITTRTKLVRFVKNEKKLRKSIFSGCEENIINKSNCLTINMDKLQWRMFQKFVKHKIQELDDNPDERKTILSNIKKEIKLWIS